MDADERVAAVLAAYPQLLLAMQPRQFSSPERSSGVACTLALPVKGCVIGWNPCLCEGVQQWLTQWLWPAADAHSGKGQDQTQSSDKEQSSGMQSDASVSRAAAVDKPSANAAGATGLGTQLSSVAGPTLQVRGCSQSLSHLHLLWMARAVMYAMFRSSNLSFRAPFEDHAW